MCSLPLHTFFSADGVVALSLAATPTPEGVTVCVPSAPTSLDVAHTNPEPTALTQCAHFVSRPHCRVCVKHSSAGCMKAQKCGSTLMARVRGQPHYRDSAQLASIGRYCRLNDRCSPKPSSGLRGTAASPRVHHGIAAPLES